MYKVFGLALEKIIIGVYVKKCRRVYASLSSFFWIRHLLFLSLQADIKSSVLQYMSYDSGQVVVFSVVTDFEH